jgi:hypothetical protein
LTILALTRPARAQSEIPTAQRDIPTAQVIQEYKAALRRCAATVATLPPAEASACFNLRIRMERAVTACGKLERYPESAKERYGSYAEVKEVCDLLMATSGGSFADPSREEAARMERERLRQARSDCERQWGNLTSMVEFCEKNARADQDQGSRP